MNEPWDGSKGGAVSATAGRKPRTYHDYLADARLLQWHPIETVPHDRPVLLARNPRTPREEALFTILVIRLERVLHDIVRPSVGEFYATHWMEDVFGELP